MFRFLFPILISVSLYAQSITLADLAFIVQKHDKISIVLASDVPKALKVDFPSVYRQSTYLPLFKSVLTANNLTITQSEGVYYVRPLNSDNSSSSSSSVSTLSPPPALVPVASASTSLDRNITDYKFSFESYKLKFLQVENVRPLLEFSGVPYSYSSVSKTIIFKVTDQTKKVIPKIIDQLKEIDIKKDQVTLKITIFDTNNEKIRDVGFTPSVSFDFSLFGQDGALLTGDAVASFKSSLKLLSSTGATNINQSSSYIISDSEKLDFKKVVSLPFLDEDFALTTDNGTNQSRKFKYRDIGFKVVAVPTIVGDIVYLDFTLSVGGVLSSGDLPTTSENTISNKFSVKKGDIVLLAGISKDSLLNDTQSIPFLEDIPLIGDIFTQKSKTDKKEFFNVSIEVF
ncbi:MAG: hypothetical protein AB1763_08690 [Campylobacterota bacterium]